MLKHALEASAKLSVDEFSFRGQHFEYGSVLTKQIDKEGAPQRFGDALVHEKRSFLGEHAASRGSSRHEYACWPTGVSSSSSPA